MGLKLQVSASEPSKVVYSTSKPVSFNPLGWKWSVKASSTKK